MPEVPTHAAATFARAFGRYLRDKGRDAAAIAADTRDHPGSLPQNALALLITLGTFGGTRQAGPGRFVLYEEARGLGPWIPRRGGHTAITFGNIAFAWAAVPKYSTLFWHEQTHYLQSGENGWRWGIRYLAESRRHGYRKNRFEAEAYERGARCAGQETCER